MTGRPSKLEQDSGLAERIFGRIRKGVPPETATVAEGVSRRQFFWWMEQGSAFDEETGEHTGKEPYRSFVIGVERAIAEAEADIIDELRRLPTGENGRADNAQAKALQFLLERRWRERFGPSLDLGTKATEAMRDGLREVIGRLRTRLDSEALAVVLEELARLGGE